MKRFVLLLLLGVAACGEGPDPCEDRTGAWVMATMFVKDRLRSPKSASFPGYRENRVTLLEQCAFLVDGYVDADNALGTSVRSNFLARIVYIRNSNSYRLEDLRME